MTTAPVSVSIIIPTLAGADRAESLERAIASVADQAGVRAVPIVVVNGPNPSAPVLARLQNDSRIRLERLAEANLPAAIRRGRALVETTYFGSIDDDDWLLPDALRLRTECLESDRDAAVVVTNGFRRRDGVDTLHRADFSAIRPDPLTALLKGNWLLPGSWLGNNERLDATLFDRMPRYLECTYLAIRFSLTGRLRFLDAPTVVWTEYGGMSLSPEFRLGQPAALEEMLRLPLPPAIRRGLERHLTDEHHSVAEFYRARGDLAEAWAAHLRSLRGRDGRRYLLATRHFIAATVRRWFHVR
ncbi:MAG: glycosyltransferase family 2 protein [Gemmatimonadales bacterium]